jgi:hypothetical protein
MRAEVLPDLSTLPIQEMTEEQMAAVPDKVTTMAELRRPVVPETQLPAVRMGFGDLQGFELMQRAAKALASSTLVPPQYQGNIPNCIIALEMAQRIGASPMLVMQNLYVVHGRPGWSAQFLIATMNQCGRFSAMRFRWQGEPGKDEWGCRAWAVEKATESEVVGPLITIALARKEGWYEKQGSKWKTIPELMLMYRAAAWLVRTHAPEISMGFSTAEELGDTYDAQPTASGAFAVQTVAELRPESEPTPSEAEALQLLVREWTDVINGCTSADAVSQTAEDAPEKVRGREEFAAAVKAKLDSLKATR